MQVTDSLISQLGVPTYRSNDTNNKFKKTILDGFEFIATLVFGSNIIHVHKSTRDSYLFQLLNDSTNKSFNDLNDLIAHCKGRPNTYVDVNNLYPDINVNIPSQLTSN